MMLDRLLYDEGKQSAKVCSAAADGSLLVGIEMSFEA